MPVYCSLGHENPDGSAFCDECGEPLSAVAPAAPAASAPAAPVAPSGAAQPGMQTCPSCGAQNPQGEAFCSNCGVSLLGAPAAVSAPVPPVAPAAPAAPSAPATSTPAPAAAPAPAGSPLRARLIVEADNQEFDISGKDNILIGREDAVSNIFPDIDLTPHGGEEGGVSRMHARIFIQNGQYMIEDENSTNYTF
ncbi:MAG: zinc-ribbon domain-containing protein, partial [Thermogemmatispora sp.]